jgi:hypothetical protein
MSALIGSGRSGHRELDKTTGGKRPQADVRHMADQHLTTSSVDSLLQIRMHHSWHVEGAAIYQCNSCRATSI